MKMEQSVPKRRDIKFRSRGITQKKTYNIQNTAKVWNQDIPFVLLQRTSLCVDGLNNKLLMLIKKKNIVQFVKSQRLWWAAHVVRMDTTRTVKKVTEWEPCSSRAVGRPRLRWLDQVEEDLKKMKVRNWIEKCKDRRLWNEIVKQARTHQGL